MYRNEWDAAVARASALETQLRQAQSGQQQDAATIAMLTQQLHAATAELQRLRGPYGAQPMYGYGMPSYIYPSRGGAVLALGILSLLVCQVLGPIAWAMGNTELERIDAGQADPSARGNVSAGRICGIISTVLMIITVVFIAIVFAAAASHTSNY